MVRCHFKIRAVKVITEPDLPIVVSGLDIRNPGIAEHVIEPVPKSGLNGELPAEGPAEMDIQAEHSQVFLVDGLELAVNIAGEIKAAAELQDAHEVRAEAHGEFDLFPGEESLVGLVQVEHADPEIQFRPLGEQVDQLVAFQFLDPEVDAQAEVEEKIAGMFTRELDIDKVQFNKYITNSLPKTGWEGIKKPNHFDLIGNIVNHYESIAVTCTDLLDGLDLHNVFSLEYVWSLLLLQIKGL